MLVAIGNAASAAASVSATTLPIVFEIGTDPVEFGLVTSLARPGGNLTGVTFLSLAQQRIGALLVRSDVLFNGHPKQLVALAERYALPAIYPLREFATAGGLMSYGASLRDALRQTGIYTGRILKGEKPGDLPVQQSAKVELIVNLKTAKALGLTLPLPLLGRADEVIE